MGFGNKQLRLEKTPSKQRTIFILRSQGEFVKVNTYDIAILKNNLEFEN